jgi:GntR family transcriptional regulator/MocR family aminotransferase
MRIAITLDPRSQTPLYRQIYDTWRRDILSGRFRRGERVPSTRELAATLHIARATVSQAYEQLLAEGYLQATHGAGTFVCRELPEEMLPAPSKKKAAYQSAVEIKLSQFGSRLTQDFNYGPEVQARVDFSRWGPDIDHFPMTTWRKLLLRTLRKSTQGLFGYARQPQGLEALRIEICAYVSRVRAVRCTPDQVVVLGGSQQALDFCARVLADPGDEVAFEDPGYLGTKRIFEANGLVLRPAPLDADGIVVSNIARKARLVYVTPSHQFPTGVAMTLTRRLELLAWVKAHRAVIIEDDYDSEYRYSGAPLPSLQGLAEAAPVVYCGTFSKVMFPGLRIGYVIVPPQLAAPFRRAKWLTDRNTPAHEQAALADFLKEGHLDRHIRRMRRLYGHRREVLIDALQKHFAGRATVFGDTAGMSMMVRFDDPGVAARAARNKVRLPSTAIYYADRHPDHEFMLGFSTLGDRSLREGIKLIA